MCVCVCVCVCACVCCYFFTNLFMVVSWPDTKKTYRYKIMKIANLRIYWSINMWYIPTGITDCKSQLATQLSKAENH